LQYKGIFLYSLSEKAIYYRSTYKREDNGS
jgi:hypothetical protein